MSYRKKYLAKTILALLFLVPFLLQGQTILFEDDFQTEKAWSRVEFRVFGKKPITNTWFRDQNGPQGARAIDKISSSTGNNIASIFDSGVICQNPYGDNAWLISPPIDGTTAKQVILEFETFYRSYNDRPQIRVGTELTIVGNVITDKSLESWATYEVFPGIQAGQYGGELVGDSGLNPTPISIDISGSAAGQSTFYIAFQYLSDASTVNGGYDPMYIGCGYSWQIDNVKIIDQNFSIACGETALVPLNSSSTISGYPNCNANNYSGNDNAFRFELTEPKTVLIELENALENENDNNPTDLDLFFLNNNGNNPGTCIASSITDNTSREELVLNLAAGVYWIAADQAGAGDAQIRLRINCFPNGSVLQIACGETLTGTTKEANNTASANDMGDCLGNPSPPYNGGDRQYQFTLTEESTVFFQLNNRSSGNVDAFLFTDNSGQLGNCLARGIDPGTGIEEIVSGLSAGTYWILIDSPNSADEANYDLAFSCFPVDDATEIFCGEPIASSTSGRPDSYGESNYTGCNGEQKPYTAGDQGFQFTLDEQQTITLILDDIIDQQLEVFLLNDEGGQPGACRARGTAAEVQGESRITETLDAGTYWVIVDGGMNAEGPFELSLNCFIPEPDEIIEMFNGDDLEGNSIGSVDDFPGPGSEYTGGDRTYLFKVEGQLQQVLIRLSNLGLGALDLFVYRIDGQNNELVAQSTRDDLANESLFLNLEPGDYYLVVDGKIPPSIAGKGKPDDAGKAAPPDGGEGPFSLKVDAYPLPTICDLEESLVIKSGNTLISSTGIPLPNNDNSFEDGIVPSKNIVGVDCIEQAFTNPVYGNIYTYYHDGNGSFTVNLLEGTATGVKAFVIKCAEADRSKSCLGSLNNGTITINGEEGFYKILVGSESPQLPYTIQVLSENPCIPEVQTLLSSRTSLASNISGEENDFGKINYQACFKISKPYDGPDRVYTFEVRTGSDEFDGKELQNINLSEIKLTNNDPDATIGLFLFNDLCEGSCLAFAEYSPGDDVPAFNIGKLSNGVYYLVVDQAEAAKPIGDFELTFTPISNNLEVPITDYHDITFQSLDLPLDANKDKVYITYKRSLFKDAYFDDTEVKWDPQNPGDLLDTRIPFTGPYKGKGPKRGYDEGEEFLFIALSDGSYLDMIPEFKGKNQIINRETNLFHRGGVSRITKLNIRDVRKIPALRVTPNTLVISPSENKNFPLSINTNQDWEIFGLPPWITAVKTKGSADESIALVINTNNDLLPRGGDFYVQIIDPITGDTIKEPVSIRQRGNTCPNNPLSVQATQITPTCAGTTDGAISIDINGETGTPDIQWSHGLGNQTTVNNLAPGTYSVSVSDANSCLANLKVDVPKLAPAEPSITGALTFCQGSTTVLDAGDYTSYLWSNEQPTQMIEVGQPGIYTVTVTDEMGCKATAQADVTTNPLPEPQITGALTFCQGTTTTLSTGAFTEYLWSNNQTTSTINVDQGGPYSVTVTDDKGCKNIAQVDVTANPLPQAQISGNLSFCEGNGTILSAGTSFTKYLWSNQQITPSINVNAAGPYRVTVTDNQGCEGTNEVEVTVNTLPQPQIAGEPNFCQGSNTVLSVPGAFSDYKWSTDELNASITVNKADTYSVIVTDEKGCNGNASIVVTANPLPVPQITGQLSFCEGKTTVLSVSGFNQYLWSNNQTTPSITVAEKGTYSVTVTDGEGCQGSSQLNISTNPLPKPQITGDVSFCENSNTLLSTTTAYSIYQWSTGAFNPAITVNTAGNYSLTVTDDKGCQGSTQAGVSVNPSPQPIISGDLSFCPGSGTQLNAGIFDKYLWSNQEISPTISANSAGTYSVTVTDQKGCTGMASVAVSENEPPQPEIAGVPSFCQGGNTMLNVSGNFSGYKWSTGELNASITVNQGGMYTVTVTDAKQCEGAAQVNVSVNPLPQPQISGDLSFCAGQSTQLDAGAYATYLWSNQQTTPTISVDKAGTFAVTVTDGNGCQGATQANATINPLPQVQISGSLSICPGSSTILDAGPFDNYLWSNNQTTQTISANSPDDYSVTVTDQNGCAASETATVIESAELQPQITGELEFCAGARTTLDAGSFAQYLWSNNESSRTISVNSADTYSVTVTDQGGCSGIASVVVTENNLPQPQIAGEPGFCQGSNTMLNASGNFTSYKWSTGELNASIVANQGGIYSVTVTDARSCQGSAQVNVSVNPLPQPAITGDLSFCAGQSTQFNAGDYAAYLWSDAQTTASISVNKAGTYAVTVTDENGCQGSTQANATINPLPQPQISGSLSICPGSTTVLDAGSFAQYLWSNNQNTQTISVNEPGEYIVTVTNQNGCSASVTATVTQSVELQPQIAGDLQFCAGSNTTLDAGSFAQYLWSNNQTTRTISVTSAESYSVTVTDQNGCSGTASVNVAENELPDPQITGQLSFCQNGKTELNAGTHSSYQWSTGELNASITVNQAGSYSVTVTNDKGCRGDTQVDVATNPLPQPQISGDLSFCTGTTTQLNAGTFSAYLWSGQQTTAAILVDKAGTYAVTVTDEKGCQGAAQVNVTTNPLPKPQIAGMFSFCPGDNTLLDAGSFAQYLWSNGEADSTISVSEAGAYSVTVTDQNGCVAANTVTVNLYQAPQPQVAGVLSFCTDGQTTLDAGSFAQYLWSNNKNTRMINVTTEGAYSVTVTDQNGCNGVASVTVSENELPQPEITGALSFCQNGKTLLNAGTFNNYEWSTGELNPSITVSQAGNYGVTVTNADGCRASTQVAVAINPLPQPQISGDLSFCSGAGTQLETGTFAAYLWSGQQTTAAILVDKAGTYAVTVTDEKGCQGAAQVNVTTNPLPKPQIAGMFSFCPGDNTLLDAGSFAQYLWSNGEADSTISVSEAGAYNVMVTDQNGCTAADTVTVNLFPAPQPQIAGALSFCADANTMLDAGSFAQYLWSNEQTSRTISVNNPGTYSVTVTDQNQCIEVASVMVIENELPKPQITGDLSFCENDQTVLNAGAYSGYEWSTGELNASITVSEAGSYAVTVTDGNGCRGATQAGISIDPLPQPQITGELSFCPGGNTQLNAGNYDSYYWSNELTTPSITTNKAGTYFVTVTDENGCRGATQANVTLYNPPQPKISGSLTICEGASTILDAGSYAKYLWSTGDATQNISVSMAGEYTVTVTDQNGCIATDMVATTESEVLRPQIVGELNFCVGSSTTLDAGNFNQYLWSNEATSRTITISEAGIYSVTVFNEIGCSGMASVVASTIEVQKPVISGITEICPESSGQLDAGSYNSYVWSIGSTNRSITIDRAGSYSVMVFNDRGCSNADTTEVMLLSDMSLEIDEVMDVSCFGAADGSILYQASGGVGEPQVKWSDEDGPIDSLFNLSGGIYSAQMTDGSSCLIERSVTLAEPRTLLSFLEPTGETGILDSNGVISVQVVGGTPPYQYLWSNGSTERNQTGLPPGKYTLTVTDASNCSYVESTLVEPFSCSLAVGINPKPVSCAGGSDGSAIPVIIGGVGDISYEWSTGSTALELTDVPAGNYTITLVDEIACKRVISFQIKEPQTPPLEIMVDSTSTGPGPGYIRVSVMGGVPPYTYEWLKDGATYSGSEDLNNPPSGIYQLIVRDAGGCEAATDEFELTVTSSREQSLLQQKLSVFPNPVGERLFIRKELPFNQPIQVIILDMLGRKVHQETLPADRKQIAIDVTDFPGAMYWVHFRMGSERAIQKIVIH